MKQLWFTHTECARQLTGFTLAAGAVNSSRWVCNFTGCSITLVSCVIGQSEDLPLCKTDLHVQNIWNQRTKQSLKTTWRLWWSSSYMCDLCICCLCEAAGANVSDPFAFTHILLVMSQPCAKIKNSQQSTDRIVSRHRSASSIQSWKNSQDSSKSRLGGKGS